VKEARPTCFLLAAQSTWGGSRRCLKFMQPLPGWLQLHQHRRSDGSPRSLSLHNDNYGDSNPFSGKENHPALETAQKGGKQIANRPQSEGDFATDTVRPHAFHRKTNVTALSHSFGLSRGENTGHVRIRYDLLLCVRLPISREFALTNAPLRFRGLMIRPPQPKQAMLHSASKIKTHPLH